MPKRSRFSGFFGPSTFYEIHTKNSFTATTEQREEAAWCDCTVKFETENPVQGATKV